MIDPAELHVQVFAEQRTGMKVGMPEVVIKVTHLPTGRVAYGCGERSQHANRQKAVAELEATLPAAEPADAGRDEVNAMDAIVAAFNTWPDDLRKKLSLHDLRRMTGWRPIARPPSEAAAAGWVDIVDAGSMGRGFAFSRNFETLPLGRYSLTLASQQAVKP